jgi:hypothetical protein
MTPLTVGYDERAATMNTWILAAGVSALICTAGHAFAGAKLFYRPIKAALADSLQSGVFTGMWNLITIHFGLSSLALFVVGLRGHPDVAIWLIAAQFAGYAAVYLAISLRLGGPIKLFQWTFFALTAGLAAIGALVSR